MARAGSGHPSATEVDLSRGTTLAVVQHRYGSPDTLTIVPVPKPIPGPDQVLVRIRAASLNARDWHEMRGEPHLARLLARDSFGLRQPRLPTRGTDLAGIVEAVGANVTRWQPGDAVFGEGAGTLAEHAVAPADQVAAIPSGVTFEQAAALPLAATAAHLCVSAADPELGSSILINGASGGVGTFAIQVAKSKRMHVTAVVSPRNAELARRLGADQIIDYTTDDFTHDHGPYHVVLDLVGNRSLRDLRKVVLPEGALVLSGGGVSGKGRVIGPMRLLIWAQLSGRLSGLRILTPQAKPNTFLLEQVAGLVAAGQVTPVIDRRFSLAETAEAVRYLETEHASAKVVISPV